MSIFIKITAEILAGVIHTSSQAPVVPVVPVGRAGQDLYLVSPRAVR
jgi:hypothetical protein